MPDLAAAQAALRSVFGFEGFGYETRGQAAFLYLSKSEE